MSTQETPCAGDEDFADSIRPSESFSCEDADTETICSISKDCDITQGHFTEDFDSTNETASMRHSADDGEASLRKQDTTMISAASNEVLALDTFATMTSNTRPVMMELPKQLPVMLLTQRDELALARAFAKSLSLMENLSFSYHADTRISITTQVNPEISREASLKASVSNHLVDSKTSSGARLPREPGLAQQSTVSSNEDFLRGAIGRTNCSVDSSRTFDTAGEAFPFGIPPRGSPLVLNQYGTSSFQLTNPLERQPLYAPTMPKTLWICDSTEKLLFHREMLSPNLEDKLELQSTPLTTYSWAQWCVVVITGFVVIPVHFLLAFGMLDQKGCYMEMRKYEKTPHSLKYHQRYSARQKLVSLLIGVVWICIVLVMIGVSFGVCLTHIRIR